MADVVAVTTYNSDVVEGWVMLAAAVFVVQTSSRTSPGRAGTMKESIEEKISKSTADQDFEGRAVLFCISAGAA